MLSSSSSNTLAFYQNLNKTTTLCVWLELVLVCQPRMPRRPKCVGVRQGGMQCAGMQQWFRAGNCPQCWNWWWPKLVMHGFFWFYPYLHTDMKHLPQATQMISSDSDSGHHQPFYELFLPPWAVFLFKWCKAVQVCWMDFFFSFIYLNNIIESLQRHFSNNFICSVYSLENVLPLDIYAANLKP